MVKVKCNITWTFLIPVQYSDVIWILIWNSEILSPKSGRYWLRLEVYQNWTQRWIEPKILRTLSDPAANSAIEAWSSRIQTHYSIWIPEKSGIWIITVRVHVKLRWALKGKFIINVRWPSVVCCCKLNITRDCDEHLFGQVFTCIGRYQLPIFHCTNAHPWRCACLYFRHRLLMTSRLQH